MKINGWWLSLGLFGFLDYNNFIINSGYEFTWIQIMNIFCIFIGFGLAFRGS